MTCPECAADNRDSAEHCSSCGHPLALPAGTVLAERYEILSLLGVGGLGRVYRAHDRMLDEVVAVKVLHPLAARSAELQERFRSEIKLARKVRHKNVCAIHEYGEHEGHRFVTMELVDGVDLHRVLREHGPLPPKDAFDVCIQVAKGLAAIHGAGVIHRDLKTPNIMRDGRGNVRLLDFGIAKLITPTDTLAVTGVQKVVGTPEYMSPEQIRGDDLDERSDIYGLGIVIYELFTGSVPFQGKSALDTLLKHMSTPPPIYGDAATRLVPSLVPVLRRCLAKSPQERFASARELLEALREARNAAFAEAAVTPQTMEARPVSLPTPPVGPPRNPLPGAPPRPAAREVAGGAPPLAPPPPPPMGDRGAGWGTGLALVGLAATAGVLLWLRYRPVERPAPPPTTRIAMASPTPAAPAPASPPPPMATETPTVPSEGAIPRRRRPTPAPTPPPTPEATPTPAPATGTLSLEVKPTAEVEVDDRDVGQAPVASLEVGAGVRVLRLTHPDYWPVTRRVSVEPGRTLRLDIDLSWEGVPRSRSKDPPYSAAIDGSPSDTYFERGLRQLALGDFQEAILTLEPVARRLEQAGKHKDLARAEFYLGIALLELNRQGSAKERFLKALELDSSLRVPGAAFSPKITSFFGTVRETARKKKP